MGIEVWEYPMYYITPEGERINCAFAPDNTYPKISVRYLPEEFTFKDQLLRLYDSQPDVRERYTTFMENFALVSRNLHDLSIQTDYIKPWIKEVTPGVVRLQLHKFLKTK